MTDQRFAKADSRPANEKALDRHALVMAIWLPLALAAVVLFSHGVSYSQPWFIGGGFLAVLSAFGCHIIVNAVLATEFTVRETALGLFTYVAALVAFLLALLFRAKAYVALFAAFGTGFLSLLFFGLLYMVIHYGVRQTFDAFDVIRDFRPRQSRPNRTGEQ